MSVQVKPSTDRYDRCQWCGTKRGVFEVRSPNTNLVIAVCGRCIYELSHKVKHGQFDSKDTAKGG